MDIDNKILSYCLENSYITNEQLQVIQKLHTKTKKDVEQLLQEYGYISSCDRARIQAHYHSLEFVDISEDDIMQEALDLIGKDVAMRYTILPISVDNNELTIAIDESGDLKKLHFLEARASKRVKFVYADKEKLLRHIYTLYHKQESLHAKMHQFDEENVSELLKQVLNTAIDNQASDIHFSPEEDALHLFFRIDGVLKHMAVISIEMLSKISVRLKTLAKIDIAQKRIALDGSFSHNYLKKDFDFRLSTLPTDMGENVVLRVLSRDAELFDLTHIGLDADNLSKIKRVIQKPHGVILVAGPTGSGKTTTLYAILNEINRLQKNILTIENPIEYRFPFIKQTQYNPKAGYTYDMAIKSFMRQDPDVILVGEIRDPQTAELAMEASITGHLVLSTIHTNDALNAISRLRSLDVAPYLVGSGMLAIISQRLVRKLCEFCKQETVLTQEELDIYGVDIKDSTIYKANGCKNCSESGYKGRIAIIEIIEVDKIMSMMISDGASQLELHRYVKEQGMISLNEDAIKKVLSGKTSLQEIIRTIV